MTPFSNDLVCCASTVLLFAWEGESDCFGKADVEIILQRFWSFPSNILNLELITTSRLPQHLRFVLWRATNPFHVIHRVSVAQGLRYWSQTQTVIVSSCTCCLSSKFWCRRKNKQLEKATAFKPTRDRSKVSAQYTVWAYSPTICYERQIAHVNWDRQTDKDRD